MNVWAYTLLSVALVSALSLIGVITLSIKAERLRKILIYMVSFSAGAFFGDVFFHLLPEVVEEHGFTVEVSLAILAGIILSFVVEKFVHWQHCHTPVSKEHPHPFAIMNLVGDGVHNLIDGLVIGASYLVSVPAGIATTLAVIFHEIPQEIGDFGVLIHGGFSKGKALLFNFITAVTAVIGAVIALSLASAAEGIIFLLVPFAAGAFLYIAAADLVPELHKETKVSRSLLQLGFFLLGIGVMWALLLAEFGH